MFINKRLLEEKSACEDQLRLFNKLFPCGVELTLEVCLAHYDKFDLLWCVENLLNDTQRKTYEEVVAPFRKAYKEAKASLWKAYEEAEAPLWKAYREAKAPLRKAFEEAEASLWKAYEEAEAKAFFNATQV